MNTIPPSDLRARILGCWLGKCIGGTLGGPWEGNPGPLSLSFYDPVPDRMMPNDDLDLQVVWLEKIRETGGFVSPRVLAEAWMEHVDFHPDEYGIVLRALPLGRFPPFSGAFDNPFHDGMGCAIRTELWACLAPGDPGLACALAEVDGCVDHTGDGLDASRFLATLESLAFVERDPGALLDAALARIPADGRLGRAIADTRRWWAETGDWAETRRRIVGAYRVGNWTDVVQNLAFIVLGWLAGGGDFGASLCAAVNCGGDADCTGATLGALLGILDPAAIPEAWSAPIGRAVVLSPGIVAMHPPADIDEMTDRILGIAPHVCLSRTPVARRVALVADEPLHVELVYPEQGSFAPGVRTPLCLRVRNDAPEPFEGSVDLAPPEDWTLDMDAGFGPLSLEPGESVETWLGITAPADVRPPAANGGAETAARPRACRNPLRLRFRSGPSAWVTTADLPASIPVLLDGRPVECPTHDIPLGADGTRLLIRFVVPFRRTWRVVLCAPADVRFSVDGAPACEDGSHDAVPAIHRTEGAFADLPLAPGAHLLEAEIGPAPAGATARFDVGDPASWALCRNLEFIPF